MKTLFATGFRPADPFTRRGSELGLLALPGYKVPDLFPELHQPTPAPAYAFPVSTPVLACYSEEGASWNLLDPTTHNVVQYGVSTDQLNASISSGSKILSTTDPICQGAAIAKAPAPAASAPAAQESNPTTLYAGGALLLVGIVALIAFA